MCIRDRDLTDAEFESYIQSGGTFVHPKATKYDYNVSGLVRQITKLSDWVKFEYNDRGQRVSKEVYNGSSHVYTYYVRDAAGTPMAIYNRTVDRGGDRSALLEHTVYGASRLGVYKRADATTAYELTDHLGNVRAVIKKETETFTGTDYYPFGMPMPLRNSLSDYRYAYQGQEKDSETGKEAFELRLWDARIGRWLTTDPAGEFASPYLGMGNNPISLIDPDGGHTNSTGVGLNEDGTYTVVSVNLIDGDNGVYVVDGNGNYDINSSVKIGETMSIDSFYDWETHSTVTARIDFSDTSGQNFFDNEIVGLSALDYKEDWQNLNFKDRGLLERGNISFLQHRYRGMLFNGYIAPARDVGNYAPGYITGASGISWNLTRVVFDGFQATGNDGIVNGIISNMFSNHYISDHPNSIHAQRVGFDVGRSEYRNGTSFLPNFE